MGGSPQKGGSPIQGDEGLTESQHYQKTPKITWRLAPPATNFQQKNKNQIIIQKSTLLILHEIKAPWLQPLQTGLPIF